MKLVTFSNGQRINLDSCLGYMAVGNVITFTLFDSSTLTFKAANVASVLSQLDQFSASTNGHVNINDAGATSLTFTGTDAPVYRTFTDNPIGIIGTGFLLSGINAIKAVDSIPTDYPATGLTIDNDNNITANFNAAQQLPAGAYVLWYSTDGGGTWTTTTLAFTVS